MIDLHDLPQQIVKVHGGSVIVAATCVEDVPRGALVWRGVAEADVSGVGAGALDAHEEGGHAAPEGRRHGDHLGEVEEALGTALLSVAPQALIGGRVRGCESEGEEVEVEVEDGEGEEAEVEEERVAGGGGKRSSLDSDSR
jgi:hypothetical protein